MYDFAYARPETLAAALTALCDDDAALALSGGQTLLPVLRARLAEIGRAHV